jgi:hypothetical protein
MADEKADFKNIEAYKEFLSGLDDIAEFRDKKGDKYSESAKRINTFSYPSRENSVITREKGVPLRIAGNELLKHKEYKDEYFSNNPSHEIIKADGTKDREYSYRLDRESGAAQDATFLEALVAEFEVLANKEAEDKISEKEQGLLDAYRVFLTERTGMNEGGIAMDEQMDAVFKSSRTEVDPVSGNEVPPGSLPEEVRDDIPAMLSEGEYVVPADVLRFYGVKFFEDLRAQAKMGLAEMEANGRIGGEPIEEETGDVGISDEDLMVIMAQAPQEEQAVGAANGGLMGFQTGGLNVPAYIKQPDLTQFGMAGPDFQGGLEYRQFTNDAGMTITIPFFNGEPMGMIPPGYTEGEAPTTTEQAAPQVSRDSGSEGSAKRARESFEASQRKEESIDYTNPQSVSEAVDEYYAGSAAPGLIGVLAPGVGLAATGIRYLQKNNLIKGIDEQLNNTELDSDKAKSLSQLKQELQDKDVYRERVGTKGFGEKIRDFFGLDGESSRPDYSSSLTNLGGPEKDLEWMGSERDAYNAAVERGDDNVVQHFESINRLRDKQNTFADKGLSRAEGAAMGLSESDMDSAEKYGGSLQRAKDAGEVEKSGGFFSSYEKEEDEEDEE